MPDVEYLVCQHEGKWGLLHEGRRTGHYELMEVAKSVAIDAAQGAGLQGKQARVHVETPDGRVTLAWEYGRDEYPGPLKAASGPQAPAAHLAGMATLKG